jgi:hypothetical protein
MQDKIDKHDDWFLEQERAAQKMRDAAQSVHGFPDLLGAVSQASTPADRKAAKSGLREDTAFHQDAGKAPLEQIPAESLEQVALVFAYGAKKYGPYNWLEHATEWDWTQLAGSMLRHVFAWLRGEDDDPESGHPHLAHAGCNVMMLLQLVTRKQGTDDRPPRGE